MSNFRKKIFLVFSLVFLVGALVACTVDPINTVRISFEKDEYEVRVNEKIDVYPTIENHSYEGEIEYEIEYSSSNESIAEYKYGVLTGVEIGEVEIKVVWTKNRIVYDVAKVKVIKSALPNVSLDYMEEMLVGSIQEVKYTLENNNTDAQVMWQALNPEIATIDEKGIISAIAVGVAEFEVVVSDREETAAPVIFEVKVIEKDYTITYNLNGGTNSAVNPAGYDASNLPLSLEPATKHGYVFVGWKLNDKIVTEVPAGQTGNIVLEAMWEAAEYTITYDLAGGLWNQGDVAPTTYVYGSVISIPNPVLEGSTFLGWYIGEEKFDGITADTYGNLDLVAKWELDAVVSDIEYQLNGGILPDNAPTTYIEGIGLVDLPVPTKEGFEFIGWESDNVEVVEISSEQTGKVVLVAKWQAISEEYSISYDLDGGVWPIEGYATYEDFKKDILDDLATFLQSKGWKGTSIPLTEDPEHVSDIMGVTYAYPNDIESFYKVEYQDKWSWIDAYMKSCGADLSSTTLIRANLHSLVYQTKWEKWPYSADYSGIGFDDIKSYLPEGKELVPPYVYESGQVMDLPEPIKEGYVFLGWFLGGELLEGISIDTKGDLELVAKWRKDQGQGEAIVVGPEEDYKTLDEAMAVAVPGDTIKVLAGTYVGGTITVEGVTIEGPNFNTNPNTEQRVAEAIFTGSIIIAADNVTINGIQLTKAGMIKGEVTKSVNNPSMSYILVKESTVVGPTIAPFEFYTDDASVLYSDISIEYSRIEATNGRAMVMYGCNINGLSVKYNEFYGTSDSGQYNDGFKLSNTTGSYDVMGNVEFISNYFENYSQYTIWLRYYGVGNYNFFDNTFVNCAIWTGNNNSAIQLSFYAKTAGQKVVAKVQFNTYRNSGIVARLQYDGATAEDFEGYVNYNKVYDNLHALNVSNNGSSTLKLIDAAYNYYNKVATDASFTGVKVWQPIYENADDVPIYGQDLDVFTIDYFEDGGILPNDAPKTYNSKLGLATLPIPTKTGYEFLGWYSVDGDLVENIVVGTIGKIELYAHWKEIGLYVGENEEFTTIADALAVAKAGDKIFITAGIYEENITISTAGLTIKGPNAGVNPNTGERLAEAVLKGTITIESSARHLVIDGLAFTEDAQIKNNGSIQWFTFQNNYVYETTIAQNAWVEGNTYVYGFIYFATSTGSESQQLAFYNNLFDGVSDVNINLSYTINTTFDGNVFKNFDRDAIRFNNGGYNTGLIAISNNEFLQDTLGGYNGVYFRIYGGDNPNTVIYIVNNKFVNIGDSTQMYSGAISARNYQEKGANFEISGNYFESCVQYIRLRNNATKENHSQSTWTVNVKNNTFRGLPINNYFASRAGSGDNDDTAPILAEFGDNYYLDNEGNVITDLTPYADKFLDLKEKGTALAEAPTQTEFAKITFWEITYELNNGITNEVFVHIYTRLSSNVQLPTLSRPKYDFIGWILDGQIVTEVEANMAKHLYLEAKFEAIASELDWYTYTYDLDGGNWSYETYLDVADDLIKDYNAFRNQQPAYTRETIPLGAWENIDLHTFFYSSNNATKWAWLAEYLGEVGGTANKKGCADLLTKTSAESFAAMDSNHRYRVSYEFRAFMAGVKFTANSNYHSADYALDSLRNGFWNKFNALQETEREYQEQVEVELPVAYKLYYNFMGWYTNPEFSGDPIVKIVPTENLTLYAKWEEQTPVQSISIDNKVSDMLRYKTLQLEWSINPAEAGNKAVQFTSSNPSVATINQHGFIEAVANGTTTIKVVSLANSEAYDEFVLEVYSPDRIELSFETTSYVEVGSTITLLAEFVQRVSTDYELEWSSSDVNVAQVVGGVITGITAGTVEITVKVVGNESINLTVSVTVFENISELDEFVQYLIANTESNVESFIAHSQANATTHYYEEINGGVNKYLFKEYGITKSYEPVLGAGNRPGLKFEKFYITVHDTGNHAPSATAEANAKYFQSAGTSIHYVTGNDGIFKGNPDDEIAYHAGDGSVITEFENTGVTAIEGQKPTIEFSSDGYYVVNGTKTNLRPYKRTNEVYQTGPKAGTYKVVQDTTNYKTSQINPQGIGYKVIDGTYHLGYTYYNSTYLVVANFGGNMNSIGIESAINVGSNYYYTWQLTAKLVAKLMYDNNISIDFVKGHNFFSGKNCPQVILVNGFWDKFIELCLVEYDILTKYADYKVTFEPITSESLDETGSVITRPEFTKCVQYKITVEKDGVSQSITLSSMVPGIYTRVNPY